MPTRKEIRLRYFEDHPGQAHIQADDRYLYQSPEPGHRFTVIGTGTMGQEHMRVCHLVGRARVHGIFDTAPDSLRVAAAEHRRYSPDELVIYDTLEAACTDPLCDALIIATPNHTHLDLMRVAARSGKAVLLEKPMATTIADAAEIVRIVEETGIHCQIGLQYRYKAVYREALEAVLTRGAVGPVRQIHMTEHRPPFLDKVGQWNKFSRHSGGTLIEKCCHYFDLINHVAGHRPRRVFALGSQAVNFREFRQDGESADILDNAAVLIEYADGLHASFNLNMFSPGFCEELVVTGEAGRLQAVEESSTFHRRDTRSHIRIQHGENAASREIELAYADFIRESGHHGGTFFEHQAFVDGLEGIPADAASIADGFWSVVVGAAAEISVTTREAVDIEQLLRNERVLDVAHLKLDFTGRTTLEFGP